MSSETVRLLLPEMILALSATLVYLAGAFFPARRGWSWLAAAAILVAAIVLAGRGAAAPAAPDAAAPAAAAPDTAATTTYQSVADDAFSYAVRWLVLAVGLVFVMLAAHTSEQGESSEFMGSLLLMLVGLMFVALANDLVLMFVALELISIPTYVLLFLGRDKAMLESGTKYFFLSILSSGLLLYGFSFLYGAAGSTSLADIYAGLSSADAGAAGYRTFAALALVLLFAGLGFRLTAVPFHFYAPDVYQGTSNPNAGLLAVVPKVAAVVALVRIAVVAMPGLEKLGWQLALALAMITMTLGNVLALWQNNVRRLMAYSSIAHAGYILIGLAVAFALAGGAAEAPHFDGVAAALFYVVVYSAATAGVFAALTYLSGPRGQVSAVDELAGLSRSFPKTAAAVAVFMFSLTGLPPLAGFWGKFTLFTGALGVDARDPSGSSLWPWFLALAIVGGLNAAISAAYYLRIVAVMYFRPATGTPAARGGSGAAWAMAVCALVVIGIGCMPGRLLDEANRAAAGAQFAAGRPRIMPDTPAATTIAPESRLADAARDHQRPPAGEIRPGSK
ncbi:MAG: NADH-quinone oxidoreductase subunit N [Pirellulales bacterium]